MNHGGQDKGKRHSRAAQRSIDLLIRMTEIGKSAVCGV